MADHRLCPALLIASSAAILCGGKSQQILDNYTTIRNEEHAGYAVRAEQRRAALDLQAFETPLREGVNLTGQFGEDSELDDTGEK